MKSMNISLPLAMKRYVDARVKQGTYSTASEYVRQLIRDDQEKRGRVDQLLLESLDSGEPIKLTPGFWKSKQALLEGTSTRKLKGK
jgi:antitoxin ParD1/3/4